MARVSTLAARVCPARTSKVLTYLVSCALASAVMCADAAQIDIAGPAGSIAFGTTVTVLPNGNVVVTDPLAGGGMGAVHLHAPSGALISTLSGSDTQDRIGDGGVVVLSNGHFVVMSPTWTHGAVINAGAVTWVNGNTGLAGVVSSSNSLVGTSRDDTVGAFGSFGSPGVVALGNGNYVVASSNWNNGNETLVGAVTWADGSTGRSGAVSAANSLIGNVGDRIGFNGVVALANSNFVVRSSLWNNGAGSSAGAVTWGNGSGGIVGTVSAMNSLVGTVFNNQVGAGAVAALTNGNYVVASPAWSSATVLQAGAVTWGDGSAGRVGEVSTANSLTGATPNDQVGSAGITALGNGNYVVRSTQWDSETATNVGAVTWANGNAGLAGEVSVVNSLVGTTSDDLVGADVFVNNRPMPGVVALGNGNYVVVSYQWDNGLTPDVGAVTWANGASGRNGAVAPTNSLIGSTANDAVGGFGVTVLDNGHYVVASAAWDDGATANAGAVTWVDGTTGLVGAVAPGNSLIGATPFDSVGLMGVTALSNGNYVIASPNWNDGAATAVGAATWADGSAPVSGVVAVANSLIGTTAGDRVGNGGITALTNGHYVVASITWDNAAVTDVGAVTWGDGGTGQVGTVAPANSLVGTTTGDAVGNRNFSPNGVNAFDDGNYAVISAQWDNGAIADAGAATLARGGSGATGPIRAANSVRGTAMNGGLDLSVAYDNARDQLAVGRPSSNIVSLFTLSDGLFADGFE